MLGIWNAFLPYDPHRTWKSTLGQIAIMAYIGTFVGFAFFVFSPILIAVLGYYIGDSVMRGVRNRWHLFTTGDTLSDPDTTWWDTFVIIGLWAALGAIAGRLLGEWGTCVGLAFCGVVFGLMMEGVFHGATKMILPNSDTKISSRSVWQNSWNNSHNTVYGDVNRPVVYDVRPKNPWSWAGYQVDRGAKEDLLFPVGE